MTMDALVRTLVSTEGQYANEVYNHAGRFPCPRCRSIDLNGGSATVTTERTYWCWSCRATGTRYVLENVILGDDALLDFAFSLTQERRHAA